MKFETTIRIGDLRGYSYYCSDKKVWDATDYFDKMLKITKIILIFFKD